VSRAAIALLAWSIPGLLGVLQVWLLTLDEPEPIGYYLTQLPPWWVWAAATPALFKLADRRPLMGRGWYRNLGWHLAAFVAMDLAHAGVYVLVSWFFDSHPTNKMSLFMALRIMSIKMVFVVALAYAALIAVHHTLRLRRARAQLEVELARAQLDALRRQIRPHFLFNALNTIAMQVRTGAHAAAVEMLSGLGSLLRETIDDTAPEVPLDRELGLVRRLLEIEQARFGDRLRVGWDIQPGCGRARIPAFLLQPLIENALRHGIGATPDGGEVRVHARRDGAQLLIEVLDDGVGLNGPVKARVGLGNVRARLERLYPGGHQLDVAARAGGGVRAAVSIPYTEAADG
jgi:LytS/YehU family sensor histidine kinase